MEEKRVLIHKHIDIFYCISIITKGDSIFLGKLKPHVFDGTDSVYDSYVQVIVVVRVESSTI